MKKIIILLKIIKIGINLFLGDYESDNNTSIYTNPRNNPNNLNNVNNFIVIARIGRYYLVYIVNNIIYPIANPGDLSWNNLIFWGTFFSVSILIDYLIREGKEGKEGKEEEGDEEEFDS